MQGSAPFYLNRSGMLLALISAAFAGQAAAAAARVDFTTPGVTVAGRDGRARPLAKGAELDNGDTVRTNDGRVQLRFTDGSYVSLQPNTDFAISDYKYEGKSDDRGFFGLVRGAMRTVTGAVGRVNRNAYRINTPTATIGVRGTGGVIQVLNDGSTLVIGTSGIWSLTNPAGSIDIPAGVSGLAPTQPNTPPKETSTQPQTSTAPVQSVKTDFKKGDDVDQEGKSEDLAVAAETVIPPKPVLVSGPGFQLVAAFKGTSPNPLTNVANQNGNATFDASGQMQSHSGSPFPVVFQSGGSHAEFGTDGILAWGRWIGPAQVGGVNENYGANSGFHYVVGTPTPVMPTMGGATYSLMGATSPTDGNGIGTLSGTLSANFATQTVGANLQVAMPSTMSAPAGVYTMSGTAIASTSTFSISSATVTGSSFVCTGGCTGRIDGFFAGASAERAGVGYHISDPMAGSRNIFGAAAFKRD
jgi:hypothetical protein